MKKSFILLLTILGMVTTSQGQEYFKNEYHEGDTVEEVAKSTIQFLDMSIENMVFTNVKSCKVIYVFELINDTTWTEPKYIPTLLSTNMKFQVTDEKWNYLDITFNMDLEANVFVKGIFNGRPFTSNNETHQLVYDDSEEIISNVEWNLR
jgi:hypothetical protein